MSYSQMRKRTGGGLSALAAKRNENNSTAVNRRRSDQSTDSVNESDEGIRSGSSSTRSHERDRNRRFQNSQRNRDSDEDEDTDDRNRRREKEKIRGKYSDDERESRPRDRTRERVRSRDSDEEIERRRDQFTKSPRERDRYEERDRRNHRVSSPPLSASESSDSDKNWRNNKRSDTLSGSRGRFEDDKRTEALSSFRGRFEDDKRSETLSSSRGRFEEDDEERTSPRWRQRNFNSRDSDSPPSIKEQNMKTSLRGKASSLDRLSASNSARLRGIRESEEESLTPPNFKKKPLNSEDRPLDIRRPLKSPNSEKELRSRNFDKTSLGSDVDDSQGLSMVERLRQPPRQMAKKSPFVDEPLRGTQTLSQKESASPTSVYPWHRPPSADDLSVPSSFQRIASPKPPISKTMDSLSNSHGKLLGDSLSSRRLNRLDGRIGDLPITSDNLSRVSNNSAVSSLNGSLRSIRSVVSKEKNFLVGSPASSSGSMLGAAELERVFPQRRVRIYILTWNMASPKSDETYPSSWDDLLMPPGVNDACDVFVVALQETPSNSREVLLRIQESLGPCFLLLSSEFYGTLGLCVFMNRDLMWYCSIPQTANIKTRQTFMTKGAAAIGFQLFGTSFVFLSTHLKSDAGNLEQRIEDYNKILRGIELPKPVGGVNGIAIKQVRKAEDLTQRFDYTFWAGDLNFRITASKETVESMAQAIESGEIPRYESLLKIDELFVTQAESKAFEAFQEGRINFPPTYKYDLNSDSFDTSHLNRIPAYTDRVLYHCKQKVTCSCVHYDSIRTVKTSDHRAVYAVFECDLKPGRDNIPLCAGDFDRSIYIEGIRRRANHLDYLALKRDKSASKVCSIS